MQGEFNPRLLLAADGIAFVVLGAAAARQDGAWNFQRRRRTGLRKSVRPCKEANAAHEGSERTLLYIWMQGNPVQELCHSVDLVIVGPVREQDDLFQKLVLPLCHFRQQ